MKNILNPTDAKSLASKTIHRKLATLDMVDVSIHGIPCLVEVPNRVDIDTEFNIYDRRGYKADWLAKKITLRDIRGIHEAIAKAQSAYFH